MAEQKKAEMEERIKQLGEKKAELERAVVELKERCVNIETKSWKRESDEKTHLEAVEFLRNTNEQLKKNLETLLSMPKRQAIHT